jgi:hypothetical protein
MKNKIIQNSLIITLGGALALGLAACGESPETTPTSAAPEQAEQTSLTEFFLEDPPSDVISVSEARDLAQPGEPVTVKGRVAGSSKPFSEDYALVMLVDETVKTCEQIPGDNCPKPWDACCVPSEDLAANRLTVQLVDEQGTPLARGLKGVNGLQELDTLIIQGAAAEGSTPENLIINAESIYRQES